MLRIVLSTDICTRSMSSETVYLNICAHTWHSVLVLDHKLGVELALPVIVLLYELDPHSGLAKERVYVRNW